MQKITYKYLNELDSSQLEKYHSSVKEAFPTIILKSALIQQQWKKIEQYFPSHQIFAFSSENELIGFVNTIPFSWQKDAHELPNDGWDWMVEKGIKDYESNTKANSLGGLQIIITKKYLGQGFSKILIAKAKELKNNNAYNNLFIPIRPTFKHKFASMPMEEYLNYKEKNKIFDPWIRTHVNSGASIIKICHNSMNVKGPIQFWEEIHKSKISKSGPILIKGALSPIAIDIENNQGEYREPNIWIAY